MLIKRQCEVCSAEFEAARANARYCCPGHRNKAYRLRREAGAAAASEAGQGETSESSQKSRGIGVRQALLVELQAAKAEGTTMGQAMLAVAHEIDALAQGKPGKTGDSLTSLVLRLGVELPRELERAATKTVVDGVEDEVGKARVKRDRIRSGASAR
jgi:hypothetical protein